MRDVPKVAVIMSTYNGASSIIKQLESIFCQVDVNVKVVVRDDSSTDNTIQIIEDYRLTHSNYEIEIIRGENIGYAKSFWMALKLSSDADYYAFSDQDDVWLEDKLIKTIIPMQNDDFQGAKLSYCRMQRSDANLNKLIEQVKVLEPIRLSKKIVFTQTYNYGAATVINREAKKLICRECPEKIEVPHDLWAGLLCYWFGRVYYVNEELYYWIRYDSSVTGKGTRKSGAIFRIKESMRKKSYPNVSYELLKYYKDCLEEEDIIFLENICNYKTKWRSYFSILFDPQFRRSSIMGTIMLKAGILFKWF